MLVMKMISTESFLTFSSLTLAGLSMHSGHPSHDSRVFKLAGKKHAAHHHHRGFNIVRRQPTQAPNRHLEDQGTRPKMVKRAWKRSGLVDSTDSNSSSSTNLKSAHHTPIDSYSLLNLGRRASTSSSAPESNSPSKTASVEDPSESKTNSSSNMTRKAQAIQSNTAPITAASTAANSSRPLAIAPPKSSSSSQATSARGSLTSSPENPSHVTNAGPQPSSFSSSIPLNSTSTFNRGFQHLTSYFKTSSPAFPLAVVIATLAGLLILLFIISVAKCICHSPKFSNFKDHPQGFPGNERRQQRNYHEVAPAIKTTSGNEGRMTRTRNSPQAQTASGNDYHTSSRTKNTSSHGLPLESKLRAGEGKIL